VLTYPYGDKSREQFTKIFWRYIKKPGKQHRHAVRWVAQEAIGELVNCDGCGENKPFAGIARGCVLCGVCHAGWIESVSKKFDALRASFKVAWPHEMREWTIECVNHGEPVVAYLATDTTPAIAASRNKRRRRIEAGAWYHLGRWIFWLGNEAQIIPTVDTLAALNERVNVRKAPASESTKEGEKPDRSHGSDWGSFMGEPHKHKQYDQLYDYDLSSGYRFHKKQSKGKDYELCNQQAVPLPSKKAKVKFERKDLRARKDLTQGNAAVTREGVAEAWAKFGAIWDADTRKHWEPSPEYPQWRCTICLDLTAKGLPFRWRFTVREVKFSLTGESQPCKPLPGYVPKDRPDHGEPQVVLELPTLLRPIAAFECWGNSHLAKDHKWRKRPCPNFLQNRPSV
jgi:hypothetical protein